MKKQILMMAVAAIWGALYALAKSPEPEVNWESWEPDDEGGN
jgi:hypothetical protein